MFKSAFYVNDVIFREAFPQTYQGTRFSVKTLLKKHECLEVLIHMTVDICDK